MDTALVFSWSRAEPGRESKALEVLAEAQVFWGKLATDGKVSEPEFLMGIDHNMLIVRGEWDYLFHMLNTDEVSTLIDKASFIAMDFTYHLYGIGARSEHGLALYATAGSELGYL